jgi:excisionase family DNA binding protein
MQLLRIPEVAETLSISPQRAYDLARSGVLPVVRLGRQLRVDPSALAEWVGQGGKALPGGWRRDG